MSRIVIGVMGPGATATVADCDAARNLGYRIAQAGWVLLTGGRAEGVMHAASQGAKAAGGLTIGILPDAPGAGKQGISEAIDIAIFTDMGSARNNINVLSSDVVVVCGMGAGTASEAALALKAGKPIVLLNTDINSQKFFTHLSQERTFIAEDVAGAIALIQIILRTV
ncbi:LOG family protein [Oscillatoria sp. FACHB-1407]|uniref:SLOG cluster 4 domain-containing protein n=1 Tax=Oscillatoria sp. FACHB-1407 TaxID=2692847 RepID=UPI0016853D49|nr:LOG family protein [Oscillatoria sp. FACHB-1407]MBD2459756.1 LOG family protein [Oscillatoria sp. FACHB-1407]